MPTEGSDNKDANYGSLLDEVYDVTTKYASSSTILRAGDINATFNRAKPTRNDLKFKQFCQETSYIQAPGSPSSPTYHHFVSNSKSQIDHFLCLSYQPNIITTVCVDSRPPLNLSSHDAIAARLNITPRQQDKSANTSANLVVPKVNWRKVDTEAYKALTECKLEALQSLADPNLHVDVILTRLHDVLREAAEEASTSTKCHAKKKKGKPNWPPHITALAKHSKALFAKWKADGSPSPPAISHQELKAAKQKLRAAQRQLSAERRVEHVDQIAQACKENSNRFYSLVRNKSNVSDCQSIDFSSDESDEVSGWSNYFQDLATPKDHHSYNHDLKKHIDFKALLLEDLSQSSPPLQPVDVKTVNKYIHSLKNNKAPDAYGISAEHLKLSSSRTVEIMTSVLNTVISTKAIPSCHKLGIVTPVHKKGKPANKPDSYRRITVTPTTGKVIEKHIQSVSKPFYQAAQNRQQRGFTEKASSANVVLILTEVLAEAKDNKQPAIIQFLDAKKAFDVVWHDGMLCTMHDQGITNSLWQLHANLYKQITSCVKWKGFLSPIIHDEQGLRQGGLTSADSFKTKTNPLLNQVSDSPDAFHIGYIAAGAPTCADDITLCSHTILGAKSLTGFAQRDSENQRYSFSTTKTKVMVVNPDKTTKAQLSTFPISIQSSPIEQSDEEVHLGVIRTPDGKATATVQSRITVARRATYAMMGAGLHGVNGLNPSISFRLIKTYIVPRILHGLEAMVLAESDKAALENYYRNLLRQIQHLPQNTANPAVYLLLGALPLEGHLDLSILSLFNRAVAMVGSLERDIIERQLALKNLDSNSWTAMVRKTLNKYDLPTAYDVLKYPRPKEVWKKTITPAVVQFWEKKLKEEAQQKSTLQYLYLPNCSIGTPHPIYRLLPTDPIHTIMATSVSKLIVQRYPLSGLKYAGKNRDPKCPICKQKQETIPHFMFWCNRTRSMIFIREVQSLLEEKNLYYPILCESSPETEQWYLQLLFDPSALTDKDDIISAILNITRRLIYQLHHHRSVNLGGGSRYTWARNIKKERATNQKSN